MSRRSSLLVSMLHLLAPALACAATWEVDPVHSSVGFAVRHLMISTVRGEFHTFSGKAIGDPANPAGATIEATVDTASLDTRNEKRDAHLKSPDFFDVAKFPQMTFKSKKIEKTGEGRARITGDLTLHGVTKEIVLDVEGPTKPVTDPSGTLKAGAHASGKINRKDFGIAWNKAMDGGGVLVGDEVEITIDVEAAKTGD